MYNKQSDYSFYEKTEMDTILAPDFKTDIFRTTDFKPDAFMIIYVVSGVMTFNEPKFSTLGKVTLTTGSCALIAPNTKLLNVTTDKCDLRCIIVRPNLLKICCDFMSPVIYSTLTSKYINLCSITYENMFCLENLCEQFTNGISPEIQVQLSKNIMFLILHHFLISETDKYSNYPTIVKKILSILNFMQNIMNGIPPVIYELGYSKSYICRIFKKYVGMSITNYITDMKLKHSIYILQRKNQSISEVCEELHFESVPYFTKIFKKKYGITPAKYRNQLPDKVN